MTTKYIWQDLRIRLGFNFTSCQKSRTVYATQEIKLYWVENGLLT